MRIGPRGICLWAGKPRSEPAPDVVYNMAASESSDSDSDAEFRAFLRGINEQSEPFVPAGSDIEVSSYHSSDFSEEEEEDSSTPSGASSTSSDNEMDGEWTLSCEEPVLDAFASEIGPSQPLGLDAEPLDYLLQVLPEEVFEIMTEETDRYARQQNSPHYQPTSVAEMKAFMGMHVIMAIVVLPSYRDHWSTDNILHQDSVARVMSKNRYEQLCSNFHLADNEQCLPKEHPEHDKLHKVRPILKIVKETFPSHYKPHKEMAVDEAMLKFSGRCSFLIYMPNKPAKWGMKAWAICDSHSYYLLNFDIYVGKEVVPQINVPLATRVVKKMVEPYYQKHHHVYFDNYFTSVPLVESLLSDGTYSCGTVRINRKGLPPSFKRTQLRPGQSLKRQKGAVKAIAYCEKKSKVCLLTTANTLRDSEVVKRGRRGEGTRRIPKPRAFAEYSDHFNAVDKNDQLRQYLGISNTAHKFWKYIFWYVWDVAMINAYVLYREAPGGPRRKLMSRKHFHLKVARGLIGTFTSRKRAAPVPRDPPAPKIPKSEHKPTKIATKRGKRNCVLCAREKVSTSSGKKRQTTYECKVCNAALCVELGCFQKWHS